MVPGKLAQAVEPIVFTASAYANHWGRCDERAYLNNATKTNNTLPLDTTIDGTNSGNFPAKFSAPEFARVVPFTCQTKLLKSVYETTDRFWLPSGGEAKCILSWGCEDICEHDQYRKSTANDRARIIPISYWSYSSLNTSLLRSPSRASISSLYAIRYNNVKATAVLIDQGVSAACKINLNSVIFASAASAANLAAAGGAQKIEIEGSADFGKKTRNNLPDYGMYLKTASSKSFTANSLSLSGTSLTVNYTGGAADQYVVVQAFKEDSLTAGTTGYAAAKQLETGQTSATIDVTNWAISSLNGYTVKIWMEDDTGSLAKATLPTTFVGTNKTETGAVQNGRVFAMKKDLQCSWGDLAALDETAYNNVLEGNGQDGTDGASSNLVCGVNPTNQKIYFGSHNGAPLEFWIAGRETAANGGAIDKDGEIMTLYQAKSVENKKFNESSSHYDVEGKPALVLDLALDPVYSNYDGQTKPYPTEYIKFKQEDGSELSKDVLRWQRRAPGTTAWNNGMPTATGTYEVRCYAPGCDNYERTYSNIVSFINIIKQTPSQEHFTITGPASQPYDGQAKEVTATLKPDITGMGEFTVKYYKVNADGSETELEGPPIDVGKYRAKIHVDEGNAYNAAVIVIMF